MNFKALIVSIVGVAFLATPVLAGNRVSNQKYHEAGRLCASKIAAKHIAAADKSAEMSKCKNDPDAY